MGQTQQKNVDRETSNEDGSAIVEFIIIFPTFILLILLTIEIGLYWADKHVLDLASFDAARVAAFHENLDSESLNDGDQCWPDDLEAIADEGARKRKQKLKDDVHFAATKRVALIAPGIGQYAGALGFPTGNLLDFKIDGYKGYLVTGVKRMLSGMPAAYVLTSVSCKISDNQANVRVRYLRNPKLPFVGGVLWMTYVLQTINKNFSESGMIELNLDDNYYGINARSPIWDEGRAEYEQSKAQILGFIDAARQMSAPIEVLAGYAENLPGGSSVAESFERLSSITDSLDSARNEVENGIEIIDSAVDETDNRINESLATATNAFSVLMYQVPDVARFIPTVSSAFIAINQKPIRNNTEWNGSAIGIAPMDRSNTVWRTWAKHMGDIDRTKYSNFVDKAGGR